MKRVKVFGTLMTKAKKCENKTFFMLWKTRIRNERKRGKICGKAKTCFLMGRNRTEKEN